MTAEEAGLPKCVWADHFAIVKILDKLNLVMLMLDDILLQDSGLPFAVIHPENPSSANQERCRSVLQCTDNHDSSMKHHLQTVSDP